MIISKKRFDEEIAKAINETQEKIYREQNLRDDFRYLRDEIAQLERRIAQLEVLANQTEVTMKEIKPTYR